MDRACNISYRIIPLNFKIIYSQLKPTKMKTAEKTTKRPMVVKELKEALKGIKGISKMNKESLEKVYFQKFAEKPMVFNYPGEY